MAKCPTKSSDVDELSPVGMTTYPYNFFMVTEYMDHSLTGLIKYGKKFSPSEIKYILREILEGVAEIHAKGIIHRDIKCANILVDSLAGVKIADFGLATQYRKGIKRDCNVVTLWYRAPELLMGDQNYDQAIDMWAVGCVFAELMSGSVLFKENHEKDQLKAIMKFMEGTEGNGANSKQQRVERYRQLIPT